MEERGAKGCGSLSALPTIPLMAKGAFSLPGIQVRGRLGGMVFVPQPGGRMTVRRAPTRVPPPSVRQAAGAARFRPVADAWNSLSIEEAALWRRYGQGPGAKPDGRAVQPNNAFTGLATKLIQMRPGTALPRTPPTEGFLGDGIRVSVCVGSPSPDGSFGRGGWGERSPEPPPPSTSDAPHPLADPPSSKTSHLEEGVLTFRASGPNAEGVVTELLTQRLKSRLRTPGADRYRTAGFVAFAAGALEAAVPVGPGAWACAVRFVRRDTGQETAVVPLGIVEVV